MDKKNHSRTGPVARRAPSPVIPRPKAEGSQQRFLALRHVWLRARNDTFSTIPLLLLLPLFLVPPLPAAERTLSYKEALRIALERNSDIKIARLEEELGEAFINQGRALFDTRFLAGADWTDDRDKPSNTVPGTRNKMGTFFAGFEKKLFLGTDVALRFRSIYKETNSSFVTLQRYWDPQLELSVSQPILKNFFGINDRRERQRERLQAEISKRVSKEKIEAAIQRIAHLYWEFQAASANQEIKKEALADAKRLFLANQQKLKLGIIEKTDLLASEANMSARENDLLLTQNQWQIAHAHLKMALQDDSEDRWIAQDHLLFEETTVSLKESLQKAFEERKDFKVAEEELKFKHLTHGIRKNSLLPELNLIGKFASNGLDEEYHRSLDDVATFDFPTYFVGVTLSIPLGNYEARSRYQKSRIEKLEALYKVEKLKNEITLDIGKKIEILNTHKLEVRTSEKITKLLKQKKIAEEEKFNRGRSSIHFVVQSQQDYLISESQFILSLLNYKKAQLDLKRSEGGLLEEVLKELL